MRLLKIGASVVGTFVVCWLPFLTSADLTKQVIHRIFPVARGLYEDKVYIYTFARLAMSSNPILGSKFLVLCFACY